MNLLCSIGIDSDQTAMILRSDWLYQPWFYEAAATVLPNTIIHPIEIIRRKTRYPLLARSKKIDDKTGEKTLHQKTTLPPAHEANWNFLRRNVSHAFLVLIDQFPWLITRAISKPG